jgi:hypothetical protein
VRAPQTFLNGGVISLLHRERVARRSGERRGKKQEGVGIMPTPFPALARKIQA